MRDDTEAVDVLRELRARLQKRGVERLFVRPSNTAFEIAFSTNRPLETFDVDVLQRLFEEALGGVDIKLIVDERSDATPGFIEVF